MLKDFRNKYKHRLYKEVHPCVRSIQSPRSAWNAIFVSVSARLPLSLSSKPFYNTCTGIHNSNSNTSSRTLYCRDGEDDGCTVMRQRKKRVEPSRSMYDASTLAKGHSPKEFRRIRCNGTMLKWELYGHATSNIMPPPYVASLNTPISYRYGLQNICAQ